nr:hypothetical protein [Tanacetum cinerariifolium]
MFGQFIKKHEEEQVANARYWKIPACCDDDDDYNSAITTNEPVNSLSMGDEHLNTILATESNEFIKSSVENLVPNPSESEGKNGCDVPACFTTFLNVLFNADYEFDSSDDQSLDILILEELLDNYSLSLPENESFHFDIPLFSRPPAKPPDGNTGILNIKMIEMHETSVAYDTSGLVPERQKASDYDNSDPVPQLNNVSSSADAYVPSQQELDLLFGPLYNECFTV